MRVKMHKAAPSRPATRPLQNVLFDHSPALPVRSFTGSIGFMFLVDEYTRMYFMYAFKSKSEVGDNLKHFKAAAEAHFGRAIDGTGARYVLSGIRSDGEPCNDSNAIRDWCKANSIRHELSSPHHQYQNGLVERAIQTAWQGSEAMRKHAGAPPAAWELCMRAFLHTRERLSPGTSGLSPYERWHNVTIPIKVRLAHLRVWGCKAYAYVPKSQRKKFGDHCRVCVLVGYSDRSKAYLLLDLKTGTIITTPSAIFDETSFPFHDGTVRAALVPVPHGVEKEMMSLFSDDNTPDVVGDDDTSAHGDSGEYQSLPVMQEDDDEESSVDDVPLSDDNAPAPARTPRLRPRTLAVVASEAARVASEAAQVCSRRRSRRLRVAAPYELPDRVPHPRPLRVRDDSTPTLLRLHRVGHVAVPALDVPLPSDEFDDLSDVAEDPPAIVSMRARLDGIPVEMCDDDDLLIRMSGQVEVPSVDPQAAIRFRLQRRLDSGGLSEKTLRRIGNRIALLTIAAKSAQLSAKPPSNHREALSGVNAQGWRSAMEDELGSLAEFGVWKLVPSPPGVRAVGCKWVFAIKRDKLGQIQRLKARLVAKGFSQVAGRDFVEGGTWAPTCRMRVFRALMAEAANDSLRTAQ